ncbi:GtrA family protein [Candidatus Pantoea multigeneris]|uniref:Bactoprenol-linked glucose translocase n=1 Tax=Candidatus Pantoea multigeneris TaxID=2608357 RepID=A0ABX0R7L1_9GAMM|nr:GtrA family protein [Pantoea multigeneris]NIF20246.1 GtrA family protein [Pantoea multigeneris]
MAKIFARYATIGVMNTAIHWITFAILVEHGQPQSLSNFIAFCVAVTFSFFANAKWTFSSEATTIRYLMYVLFMGIVAVMIGSYADRLKVSPVATLVVFSAISFICGFIYSKYIVFRERKNK